MGKLTLGKPRKPSQRDLREEKSRRNAALGVLVHANMRVHTPAETPKLRSKLKKVMESDPQLDYLLREVARELDQLRIARRVDTTTINQLRESKEQLVREHEAYRRGVRDCGWAQLDQQQQPFLTPGIQPGLPQPLPNMFSPFRGSRRGVGLPDNEK